MKEYLLPVKSKERISDDLLSVTFDISGTKFSFKSGQYITIRLIDPIEYDYKNNIRSYSIVNPPHIKDEITVLLRLSDSGFSKNIINIKEGTIVSVSDAMGNLNIEKNVNYTDVFIAGGVGVTPFKSIIEDLLNSGHSNEIILFYSNRKRSGTAFLNDFLDLANKHNNFKFIPVIDDISDKEWKFEKGFIDINMLEKYITDMSNPVFHIVGPPQMVNSVINILEKNGVKEERIRTERY